MPDSDNQVSSDLNTILYRLSEIEKKIDRLTGDHEVRIRILEDTASRLSERITLWQGGQAAFTIISAAIATILGSSR